VSGVIPMRHADVLTPIADPQPSSAASVAAVTVAPAAGEVRAPRAANLLNTIGHEATTASASGFLAGTLAATPAALGLTEGIAEGLGGASRVTSAPARPAVSAHTHKHGFMTSEGAKTI